MIRETETRERGLCPSTPQTFCKSLIKTFCERVLLNFASFWDRERPRRFSVSTSCHKEKRARFLFLMTLCASLFFSQTRRTQNDYSVPFSERFLGGVGCVTNRGCVSNSRGSAAKPICYRTCFASPLLIKKSPTFVSPTNQNLRAIFEFV